MKNSKNLSKWILSLCFILIIGILPLSQLAKEFYYREPVVELGLFRGLPTAERVRSYEKAIEDNSIVSKYARRWFQLILSYLGNHGNNKVVIGRDGWLFYRTSLDHINKPSSNFYREFDPLSAISAFHQTLQEQGVDLILLPIPGKSTIYPEYLTKRYSPTYGPAVNPHTSEFFQKLTDKGIKIVDPTDLLWNEKMKSDKLLYLEQDTHWSPYGMKLVAKYLSNVILSNNWTENTPKKSYDLQEVDVTRYGDLYDMLDFPKNYTYFSPKTIKIEKVIDSKTDDPCEPDTNSPIVLLGDSFTNIFSRQEMGWGEYAGLSEHLAYNLGISIDVIALNDGGATGSREQLARRPNALVGKKLVIWQFPTRDLTNPDSQWKIINIPKPSKIEKKIEQKKPELIIEKPKVEEIEQEKLEIEKPKIGDLEIIGEVILVSNVPEPDQVAYSDCLTYIKYRIISVERGEYKDNEIIVVFWGMRESKLMPAARFKLGERHRLVLEPLSKHEELLHFMQADDTNDYEHIPYWMLEMSKP